MSWDGGSGCGLVCRGCSHHDDMASLLTFQNNLDLSYGVREGVGVVLRGVVMRPGWSVVMMGVVMMGVVMMGVVMMGVVMMGVVMMGVVMMGVVMMGVVMMGVVMMGVVVMWLHSNSLNYTTE